MDLGLSVCRTIMVRDDMWCTSMIELETLDDNLSFH